MFRGHTDVELSDLGVQQMHATVKRLKQDWQSIYVSPLKRCRLYAENHISNLNVPQNIPVYIKDELQEMSFGRWDGRPVEEVVQQEPKAFAAWRDDPVINPPPQGEPIDSVAARANEFLTLLQNDGVGKNILVLSHGGFLRVLLCVLLNAPLTSAHRWHIPFAGTFRVYGFSVNGQWRWQIEMPSAYVGS